MRAESHASAPDLPRALELNKTFHFAVYEAAHSPIQQRVARELIFADPLAALGQYRGRALVVSAANDAQVPESDGDRIFAALASDVADKTRVTIAHANHVYKTETRTPATISQVEIVTSYADDDHPLAEGLVDAIVDVVTTT